MSLKHQIKEEETLIAYFKQMLMDVDDEQNYESDESENKTQIDNSTSTITASVKDEIVDDQSQMQLQVQPAIEIAQTKVETLPFAQTKSLETLLESVDSHTEVQTLLKNETEVLDESITKTQEIEPEVVVADTTCVQEPETITEVKVEQDVVQDEKQATCEDVELATEVQTDTQTIVKTSDLVKTTQDIQKSTQSKFDDASKASTDTWQNIKTDEEFQTLFFTVQGVRFAVPLIDLGNILECGKITQIFGKPSWYMGMTDSRGEKINIVDTLLWVKPEIGESPEKYPYLISLSDSNWALGCDVLEGNKTLNRSEVKWRVNAGSRPWLAGIVKDQMCALLHVEALVKLFEKGLDHGQIAQQLSKLS